jgi:hypothetical protein
MDSDAQTLVAVQWVNDRYRELISRVRFNHLRKVGELRTIGTNSVGTVAVTKGDTAVTGTGTIWNVSPGTFSHGTQPFWAIKIGNSWHEIGSVSDATTIGLKTAYAEDTETAATFTIVKRYHVLADDARWLGHFVHTRLGVNLGEPISPQELDSIDPQRMTYSAPPKYVSVVGTTDRLNTVNGEGILMVELYPYASSAELFKYVYWDVPRAFGIGDSIPPQIDAYVLKEGAYIDYCRFMMSRREKEGKLESAAFWRNEMNAARTKWEYYIIQATKADRAADDVSFLLQRDSGDLARSGDIKTAKAHWLAGFTRS